MRVVVSGAVNGGRVVQRLFWDFAGKAIALPPVKENYPGELFVEWYRKGQKHFVPRHTSNVMFNQGHQIKRGCTKKSRVVTI